MELLYTGSMHGSGPLFMVQGVQGTADAILVHTTSM
jgi:hypothetical protein